MKSLMLMMVALIALVVLAAALAQKNRGGGGSNGEKARRKAPLTEREQAMFNRLTGALPAHVVMPQVAFSALLTARSRAARNTFDRKVADFVICDRAFQVIAVVELDDKSHAGKEARDSSRDRMLVDCGYRVLRYVNVPDIDRVLVDFTPAPAAATGIPPSIGNGRQPA